MTTQTRTHKTNVQLATAGITLAALALAAFATPAFASHNNSSADTNNDGYISVAEGVPFYGGIQNSITTSGDTSADSALALDRFPTANQNGSYTYSRTITLSDSELDKLSESHIVVHGIDIDRSGAYDGDKDSSIAEGVPFEATVPAACGVVTRDYGNDYQANLTELNSSNARGNVTLDVNGNDVTIKMNVYGVSADLPHAQHIHIGGSNQCPPNTVGVDQEKYNNGLFFNNDRFEQFQTKFEERQEKFQTKFEERQEKFREKFENRSNSFSNSSSKWWK